MTVVQKESAYQQALDWMRARIASGDWAVGERIPIETELTELLGVGRNTLREAVKCLTSTGVLEIRRGAGTFVRARTDLGGLLTRQVAVSEMLHVYEVRRALELEAVRLACARRTDDDIRRLHAALDLRNETGRSGDGGAFADADLAFHVAVVAAAHNPVLDELFAGIAEPLRATYDFTEGVHEPELGAAHHRNVVDGIERGDESLAVQGTCGHLDLFVSGVHERRADAEGAPPSG
ncbi:FadR/GntR family transcriptional regulator [Prescottella agglutinans]|uniref:FadR/GntR family transcriptional regulator n=1 Tax=Prescottella agglutinans TaxID=1644129 RepID=UPI003D95B427